MNINNIGHKGKKIFFIYINKKKKIVKRLIFIK